ncbi:hypothetical protein C8R46DRAFT_1229213 [Mycena filopes]|nr:hypothetical protein C8R46DRAFT_1229213 [Mycena filopes]
MLIILTLFLILATLCLLGAYQLPTPFTAPLLFLWLILVSMCGTWHFDLMTAMYVVDTTSSAERSAKISVVLGWGYAAGTPGFAIGALVLLTYIVFILPESFDLPRRMKLREQWQTRNETLDPIICGPSLNAFLRPLALLKPHRNPTTGTWNLRLFWCAIHAFFSSIAAGYMWTAVINGYVLTTASIATGTSLIVLTPAIVKLGRRLYTTNDSSSEPTRNFKVDKHMAIFGWIADIIAVASLSAAQTYAHVLICVIILGASYFRLSAFRSVVVASGDALRSGEILAAIQTITSVGNTLSGVVLGSVLTATINTHPGMVFVVYSAFASVSVIALCLIQDLDRSIVDSY